MLLVGARTIERPRLVEPPDDSKGWDGPIHRSEPEGIPNVLPEPEPGPA